jgi:hypothetical protein
MVETKVVSARKAGLLKAAGNSTMNSKTLILKPNNLARLSRARNARVRVLCGEVWITATGMRQDIFLGPGEVFLFPNNALALLEAMSECTLTFEPPRHCLTWLWQWLRHRRTAKDRTRKTALSTGPIGW